MNTDVIDAIQTITQEYIYARDEHDARRKEGISIMERTTSKSWFKKHGTSQIDVTKFEFKDLPYDLRETRISAIEELIESGEIEDTHTEIDIDTLDDKFSEEMLEYLEERTQDCMEKALKNDEIAPIKEAMRIYDIYDKFDKHCRDRMQKLSEEKDSESEIDDD